MAMAHNFKGILLSFIFFVVFLFPPVLNAQVPTEAEVHNRLGNDYCDRGEFNKAVQEYEEALKIYPNYLDAYYNLGVTYYHDLKDYQKAAYYFQKFLQFESETADGQQIKKWLDEIEKIHGIKPPPLVPEEKQEIKEAKIEPPEDIKKPLPTRAPVPPPPPPPPPPLVQKEPKKIPPVPEVKETKQEENKYRQALAHKEQGNIYSKQGKHQMAIKEYLNAIELKPDYTDALYNLARTYDIDLKDKENAVKYYEEFLKYEKPNTRDAKYVEKRLLKARMDLAKRKEEVKPKEKVAKVEKPPIIAGEPCGEGIKPFGAKFEDLTYTKDLLEVPVQVATVRAKEEVTIPKPAPPPVPPPVPEPVPAPKPVPVIPLKAPVDSILISYYLPKDLVTIESTIQVRNEMTNELIDVFKSMNAKETDKLVQLFLTKMQRDTLPNGDETANIEIPGLVLANFENLYILSHKDIYDLNIEKRDLLNTPLTEQTRTRLKEIEEILKDGYEFSGRKND